MALVAYTDNSTQLGRCYKTRSYKTLRQQILEQKDETICFVEQEGEIYGYNITINTPLTQLYGFPCYVVRFLFSNVDTLHCDGQEAVMNDLCIRLRTQIESQKGYYNLRIPSHIVDLARAVNCHLNRLIFCGCTVNEIYVSGFSMPPRHEGVTVFFADREFVTANRVRMIEMATESFRSYQGQYHISPITAEKAGEIYGNWIKSTFDDFHENSILVAQYAGKVVGYCTIEENEIAVDGILSSVNANTRQLGIYKQIIATLIQYAQSQEKIFIASTQFDNYIVQGTWSSLGMRPFLSLCNFHYDNR